MIGVGLSNTKICKFGYAVFAQQKIMRFDISVDDAVGVGDIEPAKQTDHRPGGCERGEGSVLVDPVHQRAALNHLHDDERPAVIHGDVEHRHYILVL